MTELETALPTGNGVVDVSVQLGARIRGLRKQAGLTVRALASRAYLSPSLISQIERGRATPSVATLFSIATSLGLSIADLFADRETHTAHTSPGTDRLERHESREAITLDGGVRWGRLASSVPDVDFVYLTYPVGAASCPEDALIRHGGHEFGYVTRGTLGVQIGFDEYVVRTNDSISFDSMTPHRLWTIGDEPAHAIWTVVNRVGDPRAKQLR
jgi:transcriptional regulator with XRE-family HTH domain